MGGVFLLGSVFGVLAILVPISLVLGLVVLLALRGEPDDGGRGMTLYLALATFAGFLVALVAVTALSAAMTDLVAADDADSVPSVFDSSTSFGSDSSSSSGSFEQFPTETTVFPTTPGEDGTIVRGAVLGQVGQTHDDRAWTTIIQALLALAAALLVLRFHWRRLEAVGDRAESGSAATKARQAYCYTMCFLVVVTLLVSATVATFNVVQMIAPGTTGAADRGDAIESFIPVFVLAVGAAALFRIHWARVDTPAFLRPPPPPAEPGVSA
ncbi:MAG: hypothetical protein QOD30_1667 [Actinomycetota bacterium]|jgi:hypothetical protein|nr:hypothetical protein [Actinomycetota bacterium]